ncbi:MAG TPA: S41 family peptidase [Gemmatimonadaceae bacterium]|nr:S41 family peptidase [Gemmatimonadaceae bacterium]
MSSALNVFGMLLSIAAAATALHAQPATADSEVPAGCREDLDGLARKVEANYAGYVLEVTGDARAAYRLRLDSLRAAADTADERRCFFVLRRYVDGFGDPHLFLFQSTRRDTTAVPRPDEAVEHIAMTEEDVRRALDRHRGALDPIEGIYYDRGLRVGVVSTARVPMAAAREGFVAIVLTPDTSTWKAGDVRARLWHDRDGTYEGRLWERNGASRLLRGRLHGGQLLRMSPVMWGKAYPLAADGGGRLHPENPRHPTLVVRGGTVVVTMPSHDPAYRAVLDSLVAGHSADFERAERLIIDLRGNEGGSSTTSNALLPYIVSDSLLPSPLAEGEPMMLSSPDQMAYATRFFAGPAGADSSPRLQRLLSRMRENPGALVPLLDSGESMPQPPRVAPIVGPRRVGVIIDGGTVSAAEVLVARAMRSTRVTVFGEPTEGALDYQSTYIVPFQTAGRRWFLGYPTITAHTRLPTDGIRGRGIAPHVRLPLDGIDDVIGYVDGLLMRGGSAGDQPPSQ